MLSVSSICLDQVSKGPLQLRRCGGQALDTGGNQKPGQPESCASRLIIRTGPCSADTHSATPTSLAARLWRRISPVSRSISPSRSGSACCTACTRSASWRQTTAWSKSAPEFFSLTVTERETSWRFRSGCLLSAWQRDAKNAAISVVAVSGRTCATYWSIFGPVAPVTAFATEEEAIRLANAAKTDSPRTSTAATSTGSCAWPNRSNSACLASTPMSSPTQRRPSRGQTILPGPRRWHGRHRRIRHYPYFDIAAPYAP